MSFPPFGKVRFFVADPAVWPRVGSMRCDQFRLFGRYTLAVASEPWPSITTFESKSEGTIC
jgi:hypothetical protein